MTDHSPRHAAEPTPRDTLAESIALARARHAYPIQRLGKHFAPGSIRDLTEQAREWRNNQQTATAAQRLTEARA